ncbi:MAG TPA: SpoIIE family protein phosphatase [Gemmatimonadales bacterium]|nr:SpoIIE family protein phosphatase [Gemmatimonadales bacterium]
MRLWRFDGRQLRIAGGPDPGWSPPRPRGGGGGGGGEVPTPTGSTRIDPVPGVEGLWVETSVGDEPAPEAVAAQVRPVVAALLDGERQRALLADELATRYEEIDLLYAISEILGRTTRLEEAAQTILGEVSGVVGAQRASIMVHDEGAGLLRTVAARGFPVESAPPIAVDDEHSVAARVFREGRVLLQEAPEAGGRGYRGRGFLSVPILYAAPGAGPRCVGVINLTDRVGGDRFTPGDRKLVTAVASQIGVAIENARLVLRDLGQQRLRHELALAHDLQLKLLPHPSVLHGDAHVAARCVPADSVGGDFYTFTRLGRGRVGVMAGDVASHGFPAALVMALVMAAAGIHAGAAVTPDETLAALLESLATELRRTEMFFSVFYGVVDPLAGRLAYANAGHPHAFRVPRFGEPERLEATAPPIGLAPTFALERRQVPWSVDGDLLCVWTDGLVDARNAEGERFGERRLLDLICARRDQPVETILEAAFREVDAFAPQPADDRTLLVLRMNKE